MGFLDNMRAIFSPVEDIPGAKDTRPDPFVFGTRAGDVILASPQEANLSNDVLLRAFRADNAITKAMALEIPTVDACLTLIKGTMHSMPIRLFERKGDGVIEEIEDDRRVFLLNTDTGDTLSASAMIDAMVEDYFLDGGAWAYIERRRNEVEALRYVKSADVSVSTNSDPIFKDFDVFCGGRQYLPADFLRVLRDTKDGASGEGLLRRHQLIFKVAYNSLNFENSLVKTGGNKKGFLKSERKLEPQALKELREAWKKLYSDSEERMVILNGGGLDFKESSATSVELQLNENKKSNAGEICKLFGVPEGMLTGCSTSAASEDDKLKFAQFCILPLAAAFTKAFNRDLLLESEKEKRYFAFDTDALTKGQLLERMQAYAIALKNNIYLTDEIRKRENLPALDHDLLNLNLGAVLYSPETKMGFVPNTAQWFNMAALFDEKAKMPAAPAQEPTKEEA